MKVGIMQPYLFPYIGYFQTINAVDKYVIYDDVQFIKGGWINRNRLLINGKASMVTLKIKKEDFKLNINEIFLVDNFEYENNKVLKSIELVYSRAPYFSNTIDVIREILTYKDKNLSKFIINSIVEICKFLDVNTELIISSQLKKDTSLKAEEKVIHINEILGSDTYINAIGGMELYSKDKFKEQGIDLFFVKMKEIKYKQFNGDFIPNLSIIDVLMFNSKEEVKRLLSEYELVRI
ncbi:WbqC family protein [Clostridium tagluense]|uniref:WbqC family protein n=1 Tax=Clostridium tagluense TaxID=360422 RepID=UPI001CF5B544|nr:WbqC family protein [Clostridium tagluense]MCB2312383.1 WbqC family protein [Clostridium tagluense]MCB2317058.1 WbqC family protein [Clostridium tagluense]MCB2321915.1 WbqC family protein [Clostridium tagluense]MCB2326830.1 WbqC family protein [Clostridium tagluense]MCB2331642.1 WbqC family protein [Clostridium tagluense]